MGDSVVLQENSNVGLYRKNNEDYVITYTHPDNKDLHLLAVADGMGGKEDGELASFIMINSIYNYFILNDAELFNDFDLLKERLVKFVGYVNEAIIKRYGENKLGTTFCMAIVNKKNTFILNIGDSRCYVYRKKDLEQITEDNSQVFNYYKLGLVEKDDLKFLATNNLITRCVGLNKEMCICTTKIINNDYKLLLLLTDGVTDVLNDTKIKAIIEKEEADNILSTIINEAIYVDQNLQVPDYLKEKYAKYIIVPPRGKDNASGAIYVK